MNELVHLLDPVELEVLASMECCVPGAIKTDRKKKTKKRRRKNRGQRINAEQSAESRLIAIAEEETSHTMQRLRNVGYNGSKVHNNAMDSRCSKTVKLNRRLPACRKVVTAKQLRNASRRAGRRFAR